MLLAQIIWLAAPSRAQDAGSRFVVSLERSYGPGWLQSIVALPGGGYAVAGRRGLQAKGRQEQHRGSVIRLDERGGIVWETLVEGKRLYPLGGLSLTPGGELVWLGIRGDGADLGVTLDAGGKLLEEKSFGRPLTIIRHTVMLANGGWAAIGDHWDGGPPPKPALFRFHPTGAFAGKQALPKLVGEDSATPLLAPVGRDGVAVVWDAPAGRKARPRVMRFDGSARELTWDVVLDLDPELDPHASQSAPLPGGGLAIAGTVDAHGRGASWWAAAVGADGRTLWLSRVGRWDFVWPFALAGLADGAIVVGGCAMTKEAKLAVPWLAILDSKGNLASESVGAMPGGGSVLGLAALPDGGFAAAGIRGNGCAFLEASHHSADTWVRVMRRQAADPRQ
jgi:hypothetical protein